MRDALETVLLRAPAVPAPLYVRYGWRDNPDCNLFNAAGSRVTGVSFGASPCPSDNCRFPSAFLCVHRRPPVLVFV